MSCGEGNVCSIDLEGGKRKMSKKTSRKLEGGKRKINKKMSKKSRK